MHFSRLPHDISSTFIHTKFSKKSQAILPPYLLEDRHLLYGKCAIVTGGTSGIGAEIARQFVKNGCHVTITGANPLKGRLTIDRIGSEARAEGWLGYVEFCQMDHTSLQQVREFAIWWQTQTTQPQRPRALDLLVLNAGRFYDHHGVTVDGFEIQFQVNFLAHFLLARLLQPNVAACAGRVICASSTMHEWMSLDEKSVEDGFHQIHYEELRTPAEKHDIFSLQSQAKVAQTMLPWLLSRHENCLSFSYHPGIVDSDITRFLPSFMLEPAHWFLRSLFLSAWQGAQTPLYLALTHAEHLQQFNGMYCVHGYFRRSEVYSFIESQQEQEKLWQWSEAAVMPFLPTSTSVVQAQQLSSF